MQWVQTKSPDALKGTRASLASELRYEALGQSVYGVALAVANDVTVDPEGYADVAMAELIPNYGDWGAVFD